MPKSRVNKVDLTEEPIKNEIIAEEEVVVENETTNAKNAIVDEKKPAKKEKFEVGDKVKIRKGVPYDVMGRRISEGVNDKVFTIKLLRDEGLASIVCLNTKFLLDNDDIYKI